MTLSRGEAPSKPRRLGLYLPYALVVLLTVLWSLGWLWLRQETAGRLDQAAASLRAHGWTASWSSLHVGGYPFRLDVDAANLALADPSGWSVTLPRLRSEAYVFAPAHWLLATQDGLTFTRPGAPPVRIAAPLLRASVNGWDQHPPRISFVGDDLTFAGPPGAFPLASAKTVQFYTRAGPGDQGAILLEVDGGAAAPGTGLASLAGGQPVTLTLDAILSHAGALSGPDWRAAAEAWSRRGGALTLQHLAVAAGRTSLDARAGALALDGRGRLSGWVGGELVQDGLTAPAMLAFRDGAMWLGPLRVAPTPEAF